MKILGLRFKNLNSLYGEWHIDFTAPDYLANGIFALTGPTGAGKSTILDAICLALYGATPRLGRITNNANEIMSRQTGDCFAEVVFESQAGRFRCHWSQHRARKKADGNLADAKHEISHAETGELIETKKRLVLGVIEQNIGMDFERFTRSILLAQGGFDSFLKADAEQKSKILEQITGTEIYSEISRRVHERQRAERDKLNLLQAEISGIKILDAAQEIAIQQDLESKQRDESTLVAKTNEAGKAIAWLNGVEALKKEIDALSEEHGKLQDALDVFKPERERLALALKAAELDSHYATLITVRKQQEAYLVSLKAEESKLPELETALQQQIETLQALEQQTSNAKQSLSTTAPLIQTVRALDHKLVDQRQALENAETDCKQQAATIEADKKLKLDELNKRGSAMDTLQAVEAYLNMHAGDERLVSGLGVIEEQIGNLVARQQEIAAKTDERRKAEKALKQISAKLEALTKQHDGRKQDLKQAQNALEQARTDLQTLLDGRLLREYRTEKDTLLREMAFLATIAKLEQQRTSLEDGKPCPLCGAKHHPYAEGNIPVPDQTEQKIAALTALIEQAEKRETLIKHLEEAEKRAQANLIDSEKLETSAMHDKKIAEKHLADLADVLNKAGSAFTELKSTVLLKLQAFGIEAIPDTDASSLLNALQQRLQQWQARSRQKIEIEKQLSDINAEIKRLDAVIETQNKTLTEKQAAVDEIKSACQAIEVERHALFGTKNPDHEEALLQKAISDAEQAEKTARLVHDAARQKRDACQTHIVSLTDRIQQQITELEKLEADFLEVLQTSAFNDEELFVAARLSVVEREALNSKAKSLDAKQTELKAKQTDRQNRLSTELAKKVTESTLAELEPEFKAQEEDLKQLRESVAALKHQLAANSDAKSRIKEKQALIEIRKQECQRWDKLHALIGSADGKKYRNFAQGLTFELMVSHANRQLEKMTDRYLLIRNNSQPLELNVIDNYQAGEVRSTKNLSGGESFIVSLTLALGLSKMASRNVRVDSLFLDEGFGTLDEEALETALETLSELQQDGKLIGVISHVSALKERISTQINVAPVSGGKSVLAGPGVQHAKL